MIQQCICKDADWLCALSLEPEHTTHCCAAHCGRSCQGALASPGSKLHSSELHHISNHTPWLKHTRTTVSNNLQRKSMQALQNHKRDYQPCHEPQD